MIIWPEYISLNDWAAKITEDYPNEIVPILTDEDKWQEWAAVVINTGIFAEAGIPSPFSIDSGEKEDNFNSWQEWAKVFYINMVNEYNDER